MAINFLILKTSKEALPYLNDIKAATDANRDSLGFNALGVYEDYIKAGRIWVVTDEKANYLGHAMLGGRPPQELKIFQIFINSKCRGSGIASQVIQEIALYAESLSCLNLRADVASDLPNAIKFWQSQGFCALAPRRKKNASGREVFIFHKRLSTPSLLPVETLPLSINAKPVSNGIDSYVIDLNIFLTLLKNQANGALVAEIMQAAIAGEFSLFVTPEFQEELIRTKRNGADPIFDLAEKALPVLGAIKEKELDLLKEEIRPIVFPGRSKTRKDTANDESDLRHLAYCIQNSAYGFLTDEKAILRAKEALFVKYGLVIHSPQDFKIEYVDNLTPLSLGVPLSNDSGFIQISDASNIGQIKSFLDSLGPKVAEVSKAISRNTSRGMRDRKIVADRTDIYAIYAAQTKGIKHDCLEGFFIARNEQFGNREVIFQHVLECFLRCAQQVKASSIIFHVREEDFDLEKVCIERGFQRTSSAASGMVALVKIPCPTLITKANWAEFQTIFAQQTGILLPQLIPTLRFSKDHKPIIQAAKDGRDYEADLMQLETLISPSLVLLPKRAGIILSIAPAYAENLLSRADDKLPFALPEEALLRIEKAYYRNPKNSHLFEIGMPIVFYESGKGRGVIGCARIVSSSVVSCDNALKLYKRYGVLNSKELAGYANRNGEIQVITFDNFKVFPNPVSLKRLVELGNAKANLVGPERLSFEQLNAIAHDGLGIQAKEALMSIQPEYVAKILSGKKTIELRKKPFPVKDGVRVWIYSSSPTSAIEATAYVSKVDVDTPENIWKKHQHRCGISKEAFDAYFVGSAKAYALHIIAPKRLSRKIKLDDIRKLSVSFMAPQYYRYINHSSALFDALITR